MNKPEPAAKHTDYTSLQGKVKGKPAWYTPALMAADSFYSLYLHIPFCRHRCGYCDFNTFSGLESLIPEYVRALCAEIQFLTENTEKQLPVHTIYFGGGTPSLLSLPEFTQIVTALQNAFRWATDLEMTVEANPGTLNRVYLHGLRSLGIDRLSLGVQSANPEELRLLERQHDYQDVIQSVTWARQAGFKNLNLDLIYGLPQQRMETWQHTLELALGLYPEHFSLYALTLEHGTPLANWAQRGLIADPDVDLAADMVEWASERLEMAGYQQYEISNWARTNRGRDIDRLPSGCPDTETPWLACRHNLQYWRTLPYLGLGAGAHGFAGGVRTVNVLAPQAYIQRCLPDGSRSGASLPFPQTPATQVVQPVDRTTEQGDLMMMGLRLTREGVSKDGFRARFGESLLDVYGRQIERLIKVGLLEWDPNTGDILRLTARGRMVGNQVFLEFV